MSERRPLIAGNWKMHKTVSEALTLVGELRRLLGQVRDCDLAVAPPYTALHPVGQKLAEANIALAAQDIFFEDSGAYTGAVAGPMLHDVGCSYVLVGHSERRQLFGETLESSHARVRAALRAGLAPILCVGETLQQRDANQTSAVVGEQLEAALGELSVGELAHLVVAYEPVWAIGTGRVATPQQAEQMHAEIRERLRARDAAWAARVRLLYGGSVKPENAAELLSQPNIDGALVGGASLDAEKFAAIVRARSSGAPA